MSFSPLRFSTLAMALIGMIAGCGRGTYPVEGIITVDGKPVVKASVTFIPESGSRRLAAASTDDKGAFRLTTFRQDDGVLPGVYKVVIQSEDNFIPPPIPIAGDIPLKTQDGEEGAAPAPDDSDEYRKRSRPVRQMMAEHHRKVRELKNRPPQLGVLPAVYGNAATTPLKWRVPEDGTEAHFKLRSGAAGK